MQPRTGFAPIQKTSVSAPSAWRVLAISASAVAVLPCWRGLPLTRRVLAAAHEVGVALLDGLPHVLHGVVVLDDDGRDGVRDLREERGDVHVALADGTEVDLAVEDAVHVALALRLLLERAVLEVDEHGARREEAHHLDGVVRAEVVRPVGVDLELHVRAELGVDLVFELSVDALELEGVVVLEERDAGLREDLLHRVGVVRGALDRVEVLEVVRPVAADRGVEAHRAELVDHPGAVLGPVGPRGVRGEHLEAEVVEEGAELGRREVVEAGGLDDLVADVRDAADDVGEILLGLGVFAEGVELESDGLHG